MTWHDTLKNERYERHWSFEIFFWDPSIPSQQVFGSQGNRYIHVFFRVSHPWPWSLAGFCLRKSVKFWTPTFPDEIHDSLTGPKRYHPQKLTNDLLDNAPWMSRCISYWKCKFFHPVMLVFRGFPTWLIHVGDRHPAASPYYFYDWDRNPQSNIFGDPMVSIDRWHLYPSQMSNVDMFVETAWNMTRCLCLRRYRFIYTMELGSPWFWCFLMLFLTHSEANLQL